MKNTTKTITIAATSIIALVSLSACGSKAPEATTNNDKVYQMALDQDDAMKGKVVKIDKAKVSYAKAFSQNVVAVDLDDERSISYVPTNPKKLNNLHGKTVYMKLEKASSVFGIAIVKGEIVN